MHITTLTENTSKSPNIGAEHGLSLYIEACGHSILFDMGQSDLFLHNANLLGIDLSAVDLAIISHGHYDHGGGLNQFLQINHHSPVYISHAAFGAYYNGTDKYIGLDRDLASNPRVQFTQNIFPVDQGITLYHDTFDQDNFTPNDTLTVKQGEQWISDDFRHEQYLLLEENGKRVLFSGCSHRGIERIIHRFAPDVFIGGFHFSKQPPESLSDAIRFLEQQDTTYYTCHCTGMIQFQWMKDRMSRLHYLAAGESIFI